MKGDRVWVCRWSSFEIVEEGVEGEEGWLKAGGLSSKAGPRPAGRSQGQRPLADLGLGRPKAGPRPAVLILCVYKKKKKKKKEKKRKERKDK